MVHHTAQSFWKAYNKLPADVRRIADKNFDLLKADPFHPSLHFKKVGRYWSVRAGIQYRALGTQYGDAMIWFWIGDHTTYDRLIS
ncbi:MAG: hypothetical protein P1U86_17400 [Verrucomicrobiales bacterium]|nr:hypothetical protein [Verrucomicrobiales bacterium]